MATVAVDAVPAQPTCTALATVCLARTAMLVPLATRAQAAEAAAVLDEAGAAVLSQPVYSSLFGEPVPADLTTPLSALVTSASRTWAGVQAGWAPSTSATAPATCGLAIEVPLITAVAVSPVYDAEVIFTPGAKTSTHVP